MPFKFNPLTGNFDLVGSSSSGGLNYILVGAGESYTIPLYTEHFITREITIEGELIINGELVVHSFDAAKKKQVHTLTSNTTLANYHDIVLCDSSSGAITVTLPSAATSKGFVYDIKKTDSTSNSITIDGNASETIDGYTTKVITTQYNGISIHCDGSNWYIV